MVMLWIDRHLPADQAARRRPPSGPTVSARGLMLIVAVMAVMVWGVDRLWQFEPVGPFAALATIGVMLALLVEARRREPETATEQALREAQLRTQAVLEAATEGILLLDGTGHIESANAAAEAIFGFSPGGLTGMDVSHLVPAERRATHQRLVAEFDPHTTSAHVMGRGRQVRGCRQDGTTFPIEVTLAEAVMPRSRVISATVRDISDRHRFETQLQHLSLHDPLTGLGNRSLLGDRLDQALARQERHGGLIAVLACDIDHLKAINDSLGHGGGDELLIEIAARIREAVRPEDTVVRLDGDKFMIVCDCLPTGASARQLAERVLAAVDRPFRIAGHDLYPTLSIGVAVTDRLPLPDDPPCGQEEPLEQITPPTADRLIADADLALLAAQEAGRARLALFEPAMRDRLISRMELATDLHTALAHGEFDVFYQPIVDLTDLSLTGAEALIRWRHPRRGLLGPEQFLPVAARSDLMVDLDAYVITRACRDLADVASLLGRPLEIWANLSARMIAHPGLADLAHDAVHAAGLPPHSLILEVTESALMHDLLTTAGALAAVRDRGVRVAVDDFGTGHSTLSYLTRLPINAIKLDRSFVTDLSTDSVCQAVVHAVTSLGRALDLITVAEGLETPSQLLAATRYGCHRGQGFYTGIPTDLATFTTLATTAPPPLSRLVSGDVLGPDSQPAA